MQFIPGVSPTKSSLATENNNVDSLALRASPSRMDSFFNIEIQPSTDSLIY